MPALFRRLVPSKPLLQKFGFKRIGLRVNIDADGNLIVRGGYFELSVVHRGTVVRADAIASALRDESGKLTLTLRDHGDKLTVSRLYAHRFKPM